MTPEPMLCERPLSVLPKGQPLLWVTQNSAYTVTADCRLFWMTPVLSPALTSRYFSRNSENSISPYRSQ